jgi:hypothetical protein
VRRPHRRHDQRELSALERALAFAGASVLPRVWWKFGLLVPRYLSEPGRRTRVWCWLVGLGRPVGPLLFDACGAGGSRAAMRSFVVVTAKVIAVPSDAMLVFSRRRS